MSTAISHNASGLVRPRVVPLQSNPKANVCLTPPVDRLTADAR